MSISFKQAPGFRGFKRFSLVTHGNEKAMRNCELIHDKDLSKCQIIFQNGKTTTGADYFAVFLDNLQIGSVFDADQIADLLGGKICEAHVRFEEQEIVGANGSEFRHAAKLFCKYKED